MVYVGVMLGAMRFTASAHAATIEQLVQFDGVTPKRLYELYLSSKEHSAFTNFGKGPNDSDYYPAEIDSREGGEFEAFIGFPQKGNIGIQGKILQLDAAAHAANTYVIVQSWRGGTRANRTRIRPLRLRLERLRPQSTPREIAPRSSSYRRTFRMGFWRLPSRPGTRGTGGRCANISRRAGSQASDETFSIKEKKMSAPYKHGQICFNELASSRLSDVASFYQDVFGWGTQEVPAGPGKSYVFLKQGDLNVGGARPQAPFESAPHWVPYVWVDDVAAALKKALASGGKVLMPATEVPGMGTMAFVSDPAQAVFGLWHGN
jgi:predicted enzyme related to lactoylglutathione lyase